MSDLMEATGLTKGSLYGNFKDKEDISNICEYAYSKNLTLTGRGAGTGLLGQSLTTGIALDFTKYMNKISVFVRESYREMMEKVSSM